MRTLLASEHSPGWPFAIFNCVFLYQGFWIFLSRIADCGFFIKVRGLWIFYQGLWIVGCILLLLMLALENSAAGLPSENSRGRPVVTNLCSWQQPFQAKIFLSKFQNVFGKSMNVFVQTKTYCIVYCKFFVSIWRIFLVGWM